MKKIILSIISFWAIGAFAQSERMVLVEHFTQASCGPCASYNPGMQAMLDDAQNAGRLTSIKYQVSWPGYDPMNEHNPTQIDNRRTYYSINSVPNPIVNGDAWAGTGWDQSVIDTLKNTPSPFEIELSHSFSDNADEIIVNMKVKTTQTTSGNLVAHIAVIEKEINFTFPPGSNGESDFYNVMKRMLPGQNGTPLPSTMNAGDSVEITASWKMANVYDYDQLAVVAFVQNNTGKHVHQAAYDPPVAFNVAHTTNIQPKLLFGMPETNCKGAVTPEFSFRNAGSDEITSATFKYAINGGTEQTYNWTGSLMFDEEESVTLSELTFNVQPTNTITIYPTDVNGGADEYSLGDTITASFDEAITADALLKLQMLTKTNAAATKWKILDSQGNIVHRNDVLADNTLYNVDIPMGFEDCFEVIFTHDDGNSNFGGFFDLRDQNSENIMYVGSSESVKTGYFTIDPSTIDAVSDVLNATRVNVFPNPAKDVIYISAENRHTAQLLDITGKNIRTMTLLPGKTEAIHHLQPGIYFLKTDGNKQQVQKIIVN